MRKSSERKTAGPDSRSKPAEKDNQTEKTGSKRSAGRYSQTEKTDSKRMKSSGKDKHTEKTDSKHLKSAGDNQTENIDALFDRYAEENDNELIGPEGIEALCKDLGIKIADFRILLLAWKLKASKQGFFTLEEWRTGLKALNADSANKLQKALNQLKKEVTENGVLYKEVYAFAFKYCLTEPRQKTLDLDTACQVLHLVLEGRRHLSSFTKFLQEQEEYKVVNLDQWTGLMRFSEEIAADFSNYDESQAWPLLFDNFVDWSKNQK